MGEHKREDISIHLSDAERIILGVRLIGEQRKGRAERAMTSEAIDAFRLGWVKDTLATDHVAQFTELQLLAVFKSTTANGGTDAEGMAAVINSIKRLDRFYGLRGKVPTKVEISQRILSWVLDEMDKMSAGGIDGLVLGELEARFTAAIRGTYVLPPELLQADAVAEVAPVVKRIKTK
jgi:hypothetical protein